MNNILSYETRKYHNGQEIEKNETQKNLVDFFSGKLNNLFKDLRPKLTYEQLIIIIQSGKLLTNLVTNEINHISKLPNWRTKLAIIKSDIIHLFSSIKRYESLLNHTTALTMSHLTKKQASLAIMVNFGLLHDIGKFQVVRDKVARSINTEIDKPDQTSFYSTLSEGIKNILSNINNNEKCTNWIIDHPFVSAIYIDHLVRTGKIITQRDDFISMISTHTFPPNFMIKIIGLNTLGYSPEDLEHLVSAVDYNQIQSQRDNPTETISIKQTQIKKHTGNLESLRKYLGYSSIEALLVTIVDGTQLGDPGGSLKKILLDNFLERSSFLWQEVNGAKIPPSLTTAMSITINGSYAEVVTIIKTLGEPFLKLIKSINKDQKEIIQRIRILLNKNKIPIMFGADWLGLKKIDIYQSLLKLGLELTKFPPSLKVRRDKLVTIYHNDDLIKDLSFIQTWSLKTADLIAGIEFEDINN